MKTNIFALLMSFSVLFFSCEKNETNDIIIDNQDTTKIVKVEGKNYLKIYNNTGLMLAAFLQLNNSDTLLNNVIINANDSLYLSNIYLGKYTIMMKNVIYNSNKELILEGSVRVKREFTINNQDSIYYFAHNKNKYWYEDSILIK